MKIFYMWNSAIWFFKFDYFFFFNFYFYFFLLFGRQEWSRQCKCARFHRKFDAIHSSARAARQFFLVEWNRCWKCRFAVFFDEYFRPRAIYSQPIRRNASHHRLYKHFWMRRDDCRLISLIRVFTITYIYISINILNY